MTRTGPWRREFSSPIHAMQSEMIRLLEEYWKPPRFGPNAAPAEPREAARVIWSPAVDVVEEADAFVVTADLPGVDPSSIDLSVTGGVLTLKGEKPGDGGEPSGRRAERKSGPFYREVKLDGEVDFDAASAEVKHGVLRVRLPKREPVRARTIPVTPH